MGIIEYLEMETMITPRIAKILHLIALILAIFGMIYGIIHYIQKDDTPSRQELLLKTLNQDTNKNSVTDLFSIILGIPILYLIIRMILERAVVIFKIYDEIKR